MTVMSSREHSRPEWLPTEQPTDSHSSQDWSALVADARQTPLNGLLRLSRSLTEPAHPLLLLGAVLNRDALGGKFCPLLRQRTCQRLR